MLFSLVWLFSLLHWILGSLIILACVSFPFTSLAIEKMLSFPQFTVFLDFFFHNQGQQHHSNCLIAAVSICLRHAYQRSIFSLYILFSALTVMLGTLEWGLVPTSPAPSPPTSTQGYKQTGKRWRKSEVHCHHRSRKSSLSPWSTYSCQRRQMRMGMEQASEGEWPRQATGRGQPWE